MAQKTSYIVLRRRAMLSDGTSTTNQPGTDLEPLKGTVEANNDKEAIKAAAGDKEGTYVAVPIRSWKPLTLIVEKTTRVRFDQPAES